MTDDVKKAERALSEDELSDETLDRAHGVRIPTVMCPCRGRDGEE